MRVGLQDGAQVSGQQPISAQHHLPRGDKREEKEILLLALAGQLLPSGAARKFLL